MDPVSIARRAREAAEDAYTVGQVMFDLWQGYNEAGRDYETFSRDLNQLGHCCMLVCPFLLNPSCAFSGHILRPLHRIIHDIIAIVTDLRHGLDQFRDEIGRHERVIGIRLFRLITTPEHERRRRLQRFPQRQRIVLQRSQLRYATSILNLVVAVVQHPQTREYERHRPRQFNNEDSLLRDVHRAKRAVETLERNPAAGWTVTATCWIHALPSRPDGHRSPLDILADQWTTPESRRPGGGLTDGEHMREIRALQRAIDGLQQQITRLEDDVEQYRRGRQEDQETIARLRIECAAEQAARHRQRGRDAAVVRRLQAEIASRTQAHEGLERECARLTGERDAAKKDYENLEKYVTRVEVARDQAERRLERLQTNAMPPTSYRDPPTSKGHGRFSGSRTREAIVQEGAPETTAVKAS
ncbi:hypothetical protein PV04_05103 [Phialophora macrospora]|uniref:Uncharacterized protein n=1 Tax=Phialophora macrospora TaxID=1851006 RepID=A0A0D2FM54_9EURO|nr:hypothetical protein PV04_05103 [Phialophora macrospora]